MNSHILRLPLDFKLTQAHWFPKKPKLVLIFFFLSTIRNISFQTVNSNYLISELLGVSFGLGAPKRLAETPGLTNRENLGTLGTEKLQLFAAKDQSGTCSTPMAFHVQEQLIQESQCELPSRCRSEMSKNSALLIFPPWNSGRDGRLWNYTLNFSLPWAHAIFYISFQSRTIWNLEPPCI